MKSKFVIKQEYSTVTDEERNETYYYKNGIEFDPIDEVEEDSEKE